MLTINRPGPRSVTVCRPPGVCEYDLVVEAAMAARSGDVVVITGGPDAYVEGEAARGLQRNDSFFDHPERLLRRHLRWCSSSRSTLFSPLKRCFKHSPHDTHDTEDSW